MLKRETGRPRTNVRTPRSQLTRPDRGHPNQLWFWSPVASAHKKMGEQPAPTLDQFSYGLLLLPTSLNPNRSGGALHDGKIISKLCPCPRAVPVAPGGTPLPATSNFTEPASSRHGTSHRRHQWLLPLVVRSYSTFVI